MEDPDDIIRNFPVLQKITAVVNHSQGYQDVYYSKFGEEFLNNQPFSFQFIRPVYPDFKTFSAFFIALMIRFHVIRFSNANHLAISLNSSIGFVGPFVLDIVVERPPVDHKLHNAIPNLPVF